MTNKDLTNTNLNMNKHELYEQIYEIWQKKDEVKANSQDFLSAQKTIDLFIEELDAGRERVSTKITTPDSKSTWVTNECAKKAIILKFKFFDSFLTKLPHINHFDKINSKFLNKEWSYFEENKIRAVPNCYVRHGAYIGKGVVLMPSFVNIGAYIDEGTMIDTWATVGSCAQIGKNCHISGGTGIGGILEPISQNPVIIEDNCFIGARSEIAEGVVVREGSVISMGVFISSSTKIVDRSTGEITYGEIPPYSVVIPGSISDKNNFGLSLSCAVIIKKVDDSTRKKVSINEILRS